MVREEIKICNGHSNRIQSVLFICTELFTKYLSAACPLITHTDSEPISKEGYMSTNELITPVIEAILNNLNTEYLSCINCLITYQYNLPDEFYKKQCFKTLLIDESFKLYIIHTNAKNGTSYVSGA